MTDKKRMYSVLGLQVKDVNKYKYIIWIWTDNAPWTDTNSIYIFVVIFVFPTELLPDWQNLPQTSQQFFSVFELTEIQTNIKHTLLQLAVLVILYCGASISDVHRGQTSTHTFYKLHDILFVFSIKVIQVIFVCNQCRFSLNNFSSVFTRLVVLCSIKLDWCFTAIIFTPWSDIGAWQLGDFTVDGRLFHRCIRSALHRAFSH